jgi:hypothetical protein
MMTLRDVLAQLEDLDEDSTIYVDGGAEAELAARAVVDVEPEDGGIPADADGLDYLLEVSLAKEVLDVWRQWRDGRSPSVVERHEAVMYYAANDAYLPAP